MVAVVLTGALILTSINPVFAAINDEAGIANADKAAALKDLGLYSGQDANDPRVGLNDALTTQDSLIFLAKLFGYNEAANALTADQVAEGLAKFDDAASIADYAKNVVAYSATNSILSGSTRDDKFFVGAKDTVTAARFATFMLRQMGYTVPDYKKSVAMLAETKGSKIDAALTGDLTRDDAVGVMYGALTAEKASGKTVLVDIIGNRADLRARAEEAGLLPPSSSSGGGSGSGSSYVPLAATTVKALNNKQLMVTFSVPMDKESAENQSNYIVKDRKETEKSLTNTSCKLGSDRRTVTITLDSTVQDCLTNVSLAEVIVNKNILAANGEKLGTDKVFEVPIQDGTLPTVTEVRGIGNQLIEIVFSEPVYEGSDMTKLSTSNFSVKSGSYTYSVQKADLDLNVIRLEVGTNLIEGPVSVTVNEAGLGGNNVIQDYAGYKVFKNTHTFNLVKDTSVAVVTVKSASQDQVVLGFSKPVKGSNIKLYHSVKNNSDYKAEDVTTAGYVDELTFLFSSLLPHGNVNIYLVNSENQEEKITDSYGVWVPNQTITVWIETDVTPPVILDCKANKDESIGILFDEALDEKIASDPASYILTRLSDGKEISLKASLENSNEILLTFYDHKNPDSSITLQENTEHQLVIKKYQDIYGNRNTSDYKYTFTTGDYKNPEVINDPESDEHCFSIAEAGKIFIVYSEPMNEAQMLDKKKYMVSIGIAFVDLGEEDEITKVNDWTVQIYSKSLDELNDPEMMPSVKIGPIMDLAGNRLYNSVESYTVQSIPPENVIIKKAELIGKDRIKITFSVKMKTVDKDDIKIDYLQSLDLISIKGAESPTTNADGKTEAIFLLNQEIGTDAKAPGEASIHIVTIDTPSSESERGRKLKAEYITVLKDKVAPEVIFFDHDANTETAPVAKIIASGDMVTLSDGGLVPKDTTGTITISFSEPISPQSLSILTFLVKDYVVEGISCTGPHPNEVVLDVKAKSDSAPARPTVTQVYNIRDGAGNVLPSGTTWTILFNSEVDHGQETT